MRAFLAGLVVAVALSLYSSAAMAGWSVPRVLSVARPSSYARADLAVDVRGDAAMVWETVGSWPVESHGRRCSPSPTTHGCFPVVVVHVAARTARGRLVTRKLWSGRMDPTMHLSVVLGREQPVRRAALSGNLSAR
jgi:hypothetical protein